MATVRKIISSVRNFFRSSKPSKQQGEAQFSLTPTTFWQAKAGHNINYGGERVGRIHFWQETQMRALPQEYPAEWYVEGAKPDKKGRLLLKPFLWVDELLMKDRMAQQTLLPRDKKFGAMTMKELLRIARETGCGDRIALEAAQCRGANFTPGRFYNKMGFSLTPEMQKLLESLEKTYNIKFDKLRKAGYSDAEIVRMLGSQGYIKPERANGRFVAEIGRYNLTNPECIIDYQV